MQSSGTVFRNKGHQQSWLWGVQGWDKMENWGVRPEGHCLAHQGRLGAGVCKHYLFQWNKTQVLVRFFFLLCLLFLSAAQLLRTQAALQLAAGVIARGIPSFQSGKEHCLLTTACTHSLCFPARLFLCSSPSRSPLPSQRCSQQTHISELLGLHMEGQEPGPMTPRHESKRDS